MASGTEMDVSVEMFDFVCRIARNIISCYNAWKIMEIQSSPSKKLQKSKR